MEPSIIYLLKANVVISILFLFYVLVLKNDRSFWQNRFYLLFSLFLSLFLPFLPVMNFSHLEPIQRQITTANPLNSLYTTIDHSQMVNIPVPANINYVAVQPGFTSPSITQILVGVYLLISFVLLVRLIVKLFKLSLLIKKTSKQFSGGIYYCAYDGTAPFSFFKYLVINKQLYRDSELQQIISHEKVHIRQWHSIDILFAELVQAILWVNPLMIYIKRFIKLNHEYIADSEVINSGVNKKDYQLSILHSSLKRFQTYQLTNLYSSSKIKLRIKMMNLKKPTRATAYKYAFVLLLVAASYFLINPLSASERHKNEGESSAVFAAGGLKAYEGLYKMPVNGAYIKLTAANNALVVKELWSGHEYSIKQKSEFEFTTADGGHFKFTKDKNGNVTQLLAFDHDIWLKDNIKLTAPTAQQLKALEGIYQDEANKALYVQVIAKQNTLVAKQLWDGKEIPMSAKSTVSFFVQNPHFSLVEFTKNAASIATKFNASDNGNWNKVDKVHPVDEIRLGAQDLKKFEGYYEFKDRKGQFLQITATANGLVLKQLWDYRQVDFTPTSQLNFSTKQNPWFSLQFTTDNAGTITKLLAFGRDVWIRSDNYHPPVAIQLPAHDLEKFVGKYEFRNKKGQFIQFTNTAGSLVLTQSWDKKQIEFAATSPLAFFAKKTPGFTLQFTSNNSGGITRVLAFGQDIWDKIN